MISNQSTSITVSPQPQPRQDHSNMAPQKTPAPNKKKAAAKSGTKTPIKKSKVATPKTTLESKKKIKKVDTKKGGVSAFDLEAFVKVKFSALEKTAHQKKVLLETLDFCVSTSRCCRTCQDERTALWRT